MKITIPQQIQEWAFKLSDGILGEEKLPLCPWAKKAVLDGSVDCWVDENPLDLIPLPEEIKVRIVHLPGKYLTELIEIRDLCNSGEEEFIFLKRKIGFSNYSYGNSSYLFMYFCYNICDS